MTSSATHSSTGKTTSAAFRLKLQLALMLVVVLVTALALYFAQRNLHASYEQGLQDQFQSRLSFLHGAQEAKQAAVSERCRLLARSVRIRAALDENDVEDLYLNAKIELRDVIGEGISPAATMSRADFFRFLDARGMLLSPLGEGATPEPWETKLASAGVVGGQRIGYLEVKNPRGKSVLNEVVTTPIVGLEGETLGALVLGFLPADLLGNPGEGIKTGIWLDGQLYMPALAAMERTAFSGEFAKALRMHAEAESHFSIEIRGEPHLLFYKVLDPQSPFGPAYEICLYPLAESLAKEHWLRWRIIGLAGLVLLGGSAFTHFFSAGLSKPVEQLAEDSAQNLIRREAAEATLVLTEQKYRSIFENAVEGIFLLKPDGRYLSANPAMSRIYGYDSSAQLIEELTDPAQQLYVEPQQCAEFLRLVEADGMVSNFECEVRRRDGQVIWISQNARAVRDASGSLLYFEGTLEDITGRRNDADALQTSNAELEKALADLKATQQQMIQQQRLRALGQMASGIAHDFNNTLTPVLGYTELLLVNPEMLDAKAIGYLEIIRMAVNDAASIVARLRQFYRSSENSDVFDPVDLRRLAEQAITLTQPKWKDQAHASGIEIHIRHQLGEVPLIAGDESALREVLTNLIFNAVDAMPSGGIIKLCTRCEAGHAVIEIADSGMGMSEEVRQHCLEPFFSTKGERGSGLGLAMAFGIVQRHNGTIDIKTKLGKGSAFIISLPPRTEVTKPMSSDAKSGSVGSLKILLVDDEPSVRQVLTAYLEVDGHTVQTAPDGASGLCVFLAGEFDLVITDKAMPGMSGDQMAIAIREVSPKMPIIFLSGFAALDEDVPSVSVVVTKPIRMEGLRAAVVKALASV